jgi:chromosome partitioning protein
MSTDTAVPPAAPEAAAPPLPTAAAHRKLLPWTDDELAPLMAAVEQVRTRRRVLTVVNQKGGSTKTTTAVNLAYALVMLGLRVRVTDADPTQGSTTFWLTPQSQVGEGLLLVYRGGGYGIDDVTSLTEFEHLYVVPSYPSLREVITGTTRPGTETVLKRALGASAAPIDVDIIDAPPTMDAITVGAVAAADELLIPSGASPLDLQGMAELLDMVAAVRAAYTPQLSIAGFVIGRASPRADYDQNLLADLAVAYPQAVVSFVSHSTKICVAAEVHKPHQLHIRSPRNPVNVQLAGLARALVERWAAA